MISKCPNCNAALKLGDAQKAKLQKALDALEPGKKLTIKCPSCTKPIALESTAAGNMQGAGGITPPGPPDLSWLKEAAVQDEDRIEGLREGIALRIRGAQHVSGGVVGECPGVPEGIRQRF